MENAKFTMKNGEKMEGHQEGKKTQNDSDTLSQRNKNGLQANYKPTTAAVQLQEEEHTLCH